MNIDKDKIFLKWLLNRLKYKYHENDIETINYINNILDHKHIIPTDINNIIIEKICKKYHADWDFEKSELSFGHSEESKNEIRCYIRNVIKDYINEICFVR